MSLPITFHHAASTEFIEASVWYESKRLGLALEFMAVVNVAYRLLLNTLSSMPLFARTSGALWSIVFRTAFIFAQKNIALLSWQYSMAAETPPFGLLEPNPAQSRFHSAGRER